MVLENLELGDVGEVRPADQTPVSNRKRITVYREEEAETRKIPRQKFNDLIIELSVSDINTCKAGFRFTSYCSICVRSVQLKPALKVPGVQAPSHTKARRPLHNRSKI